MCQVHGMTVAATGTTWWAGQSDGSSECGLLQLGTKSCPCSPFTMNARSSMWIFMKEALTLNADNTVDWLIHLEISTTLDYMTSHYFVHIMNTCICKIPYCVHTCTYIHLGYVNICTDYRDGERLSGHYIATARPGSASTCTYVSCKWLILEQLHLY